MASSPNWKVYNPDGVYVASCKRPEDAAAIVASYGAGASIRWTHAARLTFWRECHDGVAADSYDACALVCLNRLSSHFEELREARRARQ